MANFPKRNKLPAPPAPEEATNNLSQPELAPSTFIDGRTLRATNRTEQFTTRITAELQKEIKVWSAQHDMKLNVFLERAFEALKREAAR